MVKIRGFYSIDLFEYETLVMIALALFLFFSASLRENGHPSVTSNDARASSLVQRIHFLHRFVSPTCVGHGPQEADGNGNQRAVETRHAALEVSFADFPMCENRLKKSSRQRLTCVVGSLETGNMSMDATICQEQCGSVTSLGKRQS